MTNEVFLHFFTTNTDATSLPEKFTYPFYYEPHKLSELAVNEVQNYLKSQKEWEHPFFDSDVLGEKAIGKMFGVLVVKTRDNKLGYLAAFSGKLAGTNNHSYFVPPVFDMLQKESYFLKEETVLNNINTDIDLLENNSTFLTLTKRLQEMQKNASEEIENLRLQIIKDRKDRKQQRTQAKKELKAQELTMYLDELARLSILSKTALRKLNESWTAKISELQEKLTPFQEKTEKLKNERKKRSHNLQQYLFHQYQFLNQAGEVKDLLDIFKLSVYDIPPAGAGECAAPKLLQYAFKHGLKPVCMAEFWWGNSPKSEIRKHGQYYPSCQGKCKPILGHMLHGIELDENPLLKNPAIGKEITIVYEDDYLLAVNKPAEFLSVPGKTISDSVYLRMKQQFPEATGPLIVHRLDMSTSGLLLIAKTKEVHEDLQRQFTKRTVKKRYVALLDGIPKPEEGFIDLPLRLDVDDRPRQLVCYEHGKSARTQWEIISQENGKTKVYFYPITGRTHQLRVHAAHPKGLNTPIFGDDLYGKKANRLHLHAESITFSHPITKEEINIKKEAEF